MSRTARRFPFESDLNPEQFPYKAWAECQDAARAQVAASRLAADPGLGESSIVVVSAADTADSVDAKLEPAPQEFRERLVRTHLIAGAAGALLGVAVAWVAQAYWIEIALGAPLLVPALGALFGAMVGLLAAGAWALNPVRAIREVALKDEILGNANTYIIVHSHTEQQRAHAAVVLASLAIDVNHF